MAHIRAWRQKILNFRDILQGTNEFHKDIKWIAFSGRAQLMLINWRTRPHNLQVNRQCTNRWFVDSAVARQRGHTFGRSASLGEKVCTTSNVGARFHAIFQRKASIWMGWGEPICFIGKRRWWWRARKSREKGWNREEARGKEGPRMRIWARGGEMEVLNRLSREDNSAISQPPRFLWKWKFQLEDDERKHKMTEDFREERLRRRGKWEERAAHRPKDQARIWFCYHNLRRGL